MKNFTGPGRVFWLAFAVCLMLTAYQPHSPASVSPAPAKASTVLEGVVNLNTASEAQLTLLPGVGEAVARRIITFREQHGPFQRPEDLMNVQGIGERTYGKLRPHLAVEGESTLKSTPAGGSAAQPKK